MKITRLAFASLLAACLALPSYADTSSAPAAPDNSAAVSTTSNDVATDTSTSASSSYHTNKKLQSVNINSADAQTIASSLHGIGAKRAEAIVAYRNQNGPFKSVDDLSKIKGISKKIIDDNRERITLS